MILGRQSLHGHTEVVADLSGAAESPTCRHVQLDGKVTNELLRALESSPTTAAAAAAGGGCCDLGKGCALRVRGFSQGPGSCPSVKLEDSCIYILGGQNV